jgi:hypothetical protein
MCTNIREKRFESVANARKIGRDRGRADVMGHKDNEKAKRIRSGVDGKVVNFAKRQVRLKMGAIGVER